MVYAVCETEVEFIQTPTFADVDSLHSYISDLGKKVKIEDVAIYHI